MIPANHHRSRLRVKLVGIVVTALAVVFPATVWTIRTLAKVSENTETIADHRQLYGHPNSTATFKRCSIRRPGRSRP